MEDSQQLLREVREHRVVGEVMVQLPIVHVEQVVLGDPIRSSFPSRMALKSSQASSRSADSSNTGVGKSDPNSSRSGGHRAAARLRAGQCVECHAVSDDWNPGPVQHESCRLERPDDRLEIRVVRPVQVRIKWNRQGRDEGVDLWCVTERRQRLGQEVLDEPPTRKGVERHTARVLASGCLLRERRSPPAALGKIAPRKSAVPVRRARVLRAPLFWAVSRSVRSARKTALCRLSERATPSSAPLLVSL